MVSGEHLTGRWDNKAVSDPVAKYGTRKSPVKLIHKDAVRNPTKCGGIQMRLTRYRADQASCDESMPSRTLVILPDECCLLFCPNDWQTSCQPGILFFYLYIKQIQKSARSCRRNLADVPFLFRRIFADRPDSQIS